jgi:hypothetical protein
MATRRLHHLDVVMVKAWSGSPRLGPEPKSNTGVTVTTRASGGIHPGARAPSPITTPAATPTKAAHRYRPQRDPRMDRTAPGCSGRNRASSGVPQIDDHALAADGFLPAPIGVRYLAVQDQVRHPFGQGALQLLQSRRAGRQNLDDLVQVPVCRGLRQPEAAANPLIHPARPTRPPGPNIYMHEMAR